MTLDWRIRDSRSGRRSSGRGTGNWELGVGAAEPRVHFLQLQTENREERLPSGFK